jgi:predicted amidohydrolase
MREFVAACVQIAITPNDVAANVAKGVTWLERAVREYQAELVVFPETVTTGYDTGLSAEGLWDLVDEAPGRITNDIQTAAKELCVYVVWPTYRRAGERGNVYNSAILIGPDGEIAGIYDKTHPAPWERRDGGGWALVGSADVIQNPLGDIGMIICYDGDLFPACWRSKGRRSSSGSPRSSAVMTSGTSQTPRGLTTITSISSPATWSARTPKAITVLVTA